MQRLQQQARQPPTSRLTVQYFSDESSNDSSGDYESDPYKNIQKKNDAFSEYSTHSYSNKVFENGQRRLSYMSGISAFDPARTGPGPKFIDGLDPRQTMISNADSDMSYMTDARLTQMSDARLTRMSGISGISDMYDGDHRPSTLSRPSVTTGGGGRKRMGRRFTTGDAHENHNNWKAHFRNYRSKRNSKVQFDDKISEYTEPDSNVSHL